MKQNPLESIVLFIMAHSVAVIVETTPNQIGVVRLLTTFNPKKLFPHMCYWYLCSTR